MESKRPWVDEHWFWRGFQSAVFLYAQCGPCLAWRESHRQKKQYKREKKERARNPDHPNVIRQPAPHEVNPHWAEEIRLGPSPPKKRGRKGTNTKSSRDTPSSGTLVASDTARSSRSDLPTDSKDKLPVFWNSKRYQRADEEYAYVDEKPQMIYAPPGLIRRGSSVGIGSWMMDSGQLPKKPQRVYMPPTNMPPVNELHPPVVSLVPPKKEDRAWMTAPPPSTAFMHGKKGVTTRSRSGSGHSSLRNRETSLGRQVVQKIVEEKVKNGETPAEDGSSLAPASGRVHSNLQIDATLEPSATERRSGSRSPFRLAQEKEPIPSTKSKRRPAPLRLHTDRSTESTSTGNPSGAESDMSSSSSSSKQRGRSKTTRPPLLKSNMTARSGLSSHPVSPPADKDTTTETSLAPVNSDGPSEQSMLTPKRDSATPTPLSSLHHAVDNHRPCPRKRKDTKVADDEPPLLVKDSSLQVLQDIVDPSLLLNNKWVKNPVIEARAPLPPGDGPRKENETPLKPVHVSAKEELLMEEGARRWSWDI